MSDVLASHYDVRGAEGRLVADRPGDDDQRTELARLLQVAAAIEHSLMVQYLYAAYSADVVVASGHFQHAALWQRQLLTIAREEMGHLMTVQNALRLIGAEPNWMREDLPWQGPFYPFAMEFEPFTFIAIEKYVYAEMDPSIDEVPPPGRKVSPQRKQWEVLRKKIDADVMKATGGKANHVGTLFRHLLVRLRDPAKTDDGWFDPNTYAQQASWDAWGKGYRPHPLDVDLDDAHQPPNVIVATMGTLTEAIDALTQIAGQGEAPHLRHPRSRTPSHFDRFMVVYEGVEPVAAQVGALVKNLPINPTTRKPAVGATHRHDSSGSHAALQREYISNPASRSLAQLSDLRYLMLLTNLAHAHIVAASPEAAVRATGGYLMQRSFADMFNVKTLAGLLFRSPLTSTTNDPRRAGPPFDLPASLGTSGTTQRGLWQLQLKHTQASAKLCQGLLDGTNGPPPGGSGRFLHTLADLDRNDIARIKVILASLPGAQDGE
jgi:Ferritin-like